MTSALRTRVGWFRLIAMAEGVSWVGLLIGMYLKYLGTPRTEVGVKVFGMAHGLGRHRLRGGRASSRNRRQVDAQHVVAGVAGEHRAAVQCDLPHMGRSNRPNGRRERVLRGPATRPIDTRNDVTDLGA